MAAAALFCLYILWRIVCADSSICWMQDWNQQPWQINDPLPIYPQNGILSVFEWYNPSNALKFDVSFKIDFASISGVWFAVGLSPCIGRAWIILIGSTGNGLYVSYSEGTDGNYFNNAYQDISSLNIDDGQYHLLSTVVNKISADSLHFNVSLDQVQYISFTFTNGMKDTVGNVVSDVHVMAIDEFGYSRRILLNTDATVYVASLNVSGILTQTNRFGYCSLNVTESGAAPIDPQPASYTCSPTAAPTESTGSPTTTQNPTTQKPTTQNSTAQNPTTQNPTTQNPTIQNPTLSPITAGPTTIASNPTATDNPTTTTDSPITSQDPTADPTSTGTTITSSVSGTLSTTAANLPSTDENDQGENDDVNDDAQKVQKGATSLSPMMLGLTAVIICLCILLLLTCFYFKRKLHAQSVQEQVAKNGLDVEREARTIDINEERKEEAEVNAAAEEGIPSVAPRGTQEQNSGAAAQPNSSLELQRYAEQQAMITASGGHVGVDMQPQREESMSSSDDMYAMKHQGNDAVVTPPTAGTSVKYTEEGLSEDMNDNINAQEQRNMTPNDHNESDESIQQTETRTKDATP